MLGMDAMRKEFERYRSQTSKPFNANFFCHTAPE
jgi:nitronate monooxygenase